MAFGGAAAAAEREAVLAAIHQLENPRNLQRPGPRGELGAYQFRRSTWLMHTDEPFERALDRATADVVAQRHYEWIKRGLRRAKLPTSPYFIALAWNGGLSATVRGRTAASSRDYASRAANLTATLQRETLVARAE